MSTSRSRTKRKGVATAECAICLPIIVTLTLGVIETCSVLFLKEAITIAAYEGARVGIQRGGSNARVRSRVEDFLTSRRIRHTNQAVEFGELDFDNAGELQHVTTKVTVPCNGNTVIGWFFTGRSVDASVTLRKEFQNP